MTSIEVMPELTMHKKLVGLKAHDIDKVASGKLRQVGCQPPRKCQVSIRKKGQTPAVPN